MLSYKLLFLASLGQNSLLQQKNLISELDFRSKTYTGIYVCWENSVLSWSIVALEL